MNLFFYRQKFESIILKKKTCAFKVFFFFPPRYYLHAKKINWLFLLCKKKKEKYLIAFKIKFNINFHFAKKKYE
jgi:hypothetical protein